MKHLMVFCVGIAVAVAEPNATKALQNAPLTHVPGNVPVQPASENLPQQPLPQIPASSVPQVPHDARRASRAPRPELLKPQLPRLPDAPSQRAPDHLIEGAHGGDAHHGRIRESAVSRLFENALRVHPGEFAEADVRDGHFTLDQTSGDAGLLGDGEHGNRLPGGIPGEIQRQSYGDRGYAAPEGMPDSPVPDRSGQGPTRLVGPPSANLRDAGSGAASSIKIESLEVRPQGRVIIEDMQSSVEPATESEAAPTRSRVIIEDIQIEVVPPTDKETPEIPKEDLTKLQDGNAPTSGGTVNPFTGIDHAPPPRHPDQVTPGPEGAAQLPDGIRLRPGDLEVNPDPGSHRREHNPDETMRRFVSPDQVRP